MISANRNIAELKKLFDQYYTPVLIYCTTLLKDRDDAKDIVQQAFVSLWQKMNTAGFTISARAYLYKTVYHASLNFLKHKKITRHYENDIHKNTDGLIQAGPGEEKELLEKLLSAISRLPEQCAKIFTMSRFEGLKYREIAEALHISEKTVENQMSKALRLLRDALQEYLPILIFLISCWNVTR
ncbi:MAG TPA: RNA polymerase sigma-70 factor [Puia sp.]|nr:RNA polymerase sigma-70 factor [Puia sp.]